MTRGIVFAEDGVVTPPSDAQSSEVEQLRRRVARVNDVVLRQDDLIYALKQQVAQLEQAVARLSPRYQAWAKEFAKPSAWSSSAYLGVDWGDEDEWVKYPHR